MARLLYPILPFLCFLHFFLYVTAIDTRRFWQVTDFHHDPNYTTTGDPGSLPSDRTTMCHLTVNYTSNSSLGIFGDYLCDAPWTLVEAAVRGMRDIEGDPDFILWTGDDPPHVPNAALNSAKVLGIIRNVTDLIRHYFPETLVFPVLGNHDYHPKGQMPPDSKDDEIYRAIAEMWSGDQWLGLEESDQVEKFRLGGFFDTVYQPPRGGQTLRMVGLNTVYYYHQDKLTGDLEDPAGQFEWMASVMEDAREKGQKVYLFGHVPPGMFERSVNTSWFYPHFNTRFVQFIIDNSDIIAGQFFAHQHSDSFKLFYVRKGDALVGEETETPAAVMYLAPSVTPWKTTLTGVSANNPSIRLYEYDPKTGAIVNIQQYYTNLTEANLKGEVKWELEYSATTVYNLENVNSSSIGRLVDRFSESNEDFDKYYDYNAVSYQGEEPCDAECKATQICSIVCPSYDQYYACLNNPHNARQLCTLESSSSDSSSSPLPVYAGVLVGVGAGLALFLFLFLLLWYAGRRKRNMGFKIESKEPLLSGSD